jgi:Phage baseplate assembly protein W
MAVNKDDIKHLHWQLAYRQTEPEGGDIVAAYDDIAQAIRLLILTPIGSVPSNPAKGCDLLSFIDRPPEIAIPIIARAAWEAVSTWEPRVEVGTVKVIAKAPYHFVATVPWRVRNSVKAEFQQTEVDMNLTGIAA